jgi:hypothetical protein
MKSKIARNVMKKARDTEATLKGMEDQMTKVETIVSSLHSNINEQIPEGPRNAKKALQLEDRKSELVSRANTMDR